MSDPYDGCTKVSSRCPVEGTVYGYYPNLAANVIMLVVFGTCAAAQVILGIKYRVQTFAILVCLGCIGEVGGYVGRVMMHSNPWSDGGFTIQVLLLIVSPSLLAAALYITLKHLLAHFGPEYSKLKPTLYTWIFITCDAVGFAMQLAGGGVQASATKGKEGEDRSKMGNKIMIAGIIFQAVTMGFCALLGVDYAIRRRKARAVRQGADYYQSPPRKKGFTFYLVCSMTAFVLILIRCIYRLVGDPVYSQM